MTPSTLQPTLAASIPQLVRELSPVKQWSLRDGSEVTVRPICAADRTLELNFLNALSPQSIYQRLMSMRRLLPGELDRLTNIDYDRQMALIATTAIAGAETQIGVSRYVRDGDGDDTGAEFAIVIADAYQYRGLGRRLLGNLIDHARGVGVRRLWGITLATNQAMRELGRALGFAVRPCPDDATVVCLVKGL